ncbi:MULTISPECIES: hypothetical protein [unclassified Micromonospora]|uniref:hypothetical protein n=1 Tax=unclassified Micromonospora TaxID=2617518 RepID=UPI001B35E657|nr:MULTISPECIES: hypothetical protein [unclassified Micromonospora]MBQ1041103.1 hypothetical protein [Micromonospora sp. C72]MBQ1055096.1 hypothetical protein [Micromonospora sp. C32]
MRAVRAVLATVVAAAAALAFTATAAQAAPRPTPHADTQRAAAGSGYLYVSQDAYWSGRWCWWYNADTNWDTINVAENANCDNNNRASMRNLASSAWNDSNSGRPVALYIHPNYTGAYACLGAGDAWDDLTGAWFSWGSNRDGYMANTNDNIASHRWRTSCSAG